MYKPKLNYTDVAAFLEKWVDPPISNLKHVDAGFVSTIFSFGMDSGASGSEKLIAKFSSHENDGGLEKNQFIYELTKGGRAFCSGDPCGWGDRTAGFEYDRL